MPARDVEVVIGAKPELADGLGQASQQLDKWARATSQEVQKTSKSIGDHLRQFAREERQEGRAVGFFVSELSNIAPISDKVKIALSGVGSVLVGGLGFGAALNIASAGLQLLVGHFQEAAKAAEEFAKNAAKAIDDLDAKIDGLRQKTGAGRANEQWNLVQAQMEERRGLIAELQAQIEAEKANPASLRNDDQIRAWEEQIQAAKDQIFQLERRAEKLTTIVALELQNADVAQALANTAKEEADARERAAKAVRDKEAAFREAVARAKREALDQAATMTGWEEEGARRPEYEALKRKDYIEALREMKRALAESDETMRSFVSAGVDGLLGLGRAAFEGSEQVKRSLQSMLDVFSRIIEQMISKWLTAQMMGVFGAGGGGEAPGSGGIPADQVPQEIGADMAGKMTPSGVAAGRTAKLARGGARTEVHLHVAGDVVDPDGWFKKNRRALGRAIGTLAYEGGI